MQQAKIKNIAENEAHNYLLPLFPNIRKLPESKKKSPDFDLGENIQVEVYCPQESDKERTKTKGKFEKQSGPVRLVITHPVTGSDGKALQFPANKTIDRVLNKKWEHDQFHPNKNNILWLDLRNGFKLSYRDCGPIKSIDHAGYTYVGMFGVWHAFYGLENDSVFFSERTVLRFLQAQSIHKQKKQGFFRRKQHVAAALVLCTDGTILFENPWTINPLEDDTRLKLSRIYQFRPEASFISIGKSKNYLERQIEYHLQRNKWLAANITVPA